MNRTRINRVFGIASQLYRRVLDLSFLTDFKLGVILCLAVVDGHPKEGAETLPCYPCPTKPRIQTKPILG